jgi:nucleoside-diphosphate-sugar epimerase
MTRVLIIGGSSMVGKRLRARLGSAYAVSTAGRDGLADVHFDLTADTQPDNGRQFDVVIHCAASFGGDDAKGLVANELTNSVGALRVGALAARVGCKHLVYLSSIFSYDHPDNGYFGSYGLSKRHGQENLELLCRTTGMRFTSLLPTQLYDEYGAARKHQPLFYRIMDCARAGSDVTLYGKRDVLRNLLFVGDLAVIVERIIAGQVSGIFPCVHPESQTLSDIARIAFDVFGKGGRVVFQPDKPDIPGVYVPEPGELYALLGYWPETSLRQGIEKMRDVPDC